MANTSRKGVSFSDLNPSSGNNEDDVILKDWSSDQTQIKFENGVKRLTVRPVGFVYSMARHWPKAPKSGSTTPPIWCPRWNPTTNKFDESCGCPLHEDFNDKAQKVLVFNCIVREWQEGKQRKSNPTGLMILTSSLTSEIVEIVGINKAAIQDPDKGCDLRLAYNRDEKGPKKWSIQRVERTPLTDEEKEYETVDIEKLSPNFDDKKFAETYCRAMRNKMVRLGYYVLPLNNGKDGWDAYKKDPNGKPYTQFPELAGDDKAASVEPRRRNNVDDDDDMPVRKPAPAASKRHEEPADEDLGLKRRQPVDDDDEAAPPPPAKKKAVAAEDDDDVPFDVTPAKKPAKAPKLAVPETHTAWAEKMAAAEITIAWKDEGGEVVPACMGDFEGAPKCKKCPSREQCIGS